jgi:hypothetical protein
MSHVDRLARCARRIGDALDDDIRAMLRMCGGDAVAALRITLIANAFLEAEGTAKGRGVVRLLTG